MALDIRHESLNRSRRHTLYLGLGSNLGDRRENLRRSLEMIASREGFRCVKTSSIRETLPEGKSDQPTFLNQVAEFETVNSPEETLGVVNGVERELGRVRGERWGPRTIDIDILFYDDLSVEGESLRIPHPRLHIRRFVLEPMAEIAPDWIHPVYRCSIKNMLDSLPAESENYK